MLSVLLFVAALALIAQALMGLGFLVSSIREKEERATGGYSRSCCRAR